MTLNVTLEDTYKDSELDVKFGESCDCGRECESDTEMDVDFGEVQTITAGGTKDYDRLQNRPSINEHVLVGGENSLESIGIGLTSNQEIAKLFK